MIKTTNTSGFGAIVNMILPLDPNETVFALAVGSRGGAILHFEPPQIYETYSLIPNLGVTHGIVTSCDKKYLYLFGRDYGISVYNIEDLKNPLYITFVGYNSVVTGFLSKKNCDLFYVAGGFKGFSIFNISEPASP